VFPPDKAILRKAQINQSNKTQNSKVQTFRYYKNI